MVFRDPFKVDVGSLGTLEIGEGEYCYVGSAMNGLDQRIRRHMSPKKHMRWHIDRLTSSADGTEAYASCVAECGLARMAEDSGCIPVFKGFGSSDCGCRTHLFFVDGASKQTLLNMSAAQRFVC